jgi:hypothetical protein
VSRSAPVRFYLPLSPAMLRAARDRGGFGPAPLRGHAVTAALAGASAGTGGADDEDLEYAATTAAAVDALGLLTPDQPPCRMVAALDVPAVEPVPGAAEPSAVTVAHEVPLRRLASVLADAAGAAADVAAARDAVRAGDAAAEALVERCLEHELGWYAAQELDQLLDG